MEKVIENNNPFGYKYELYQLPYWKTYKDEETGLELIINLLDIKYIKSYIDMVPVLDEILPIECRKYMVYIKVDQAVTDEIQVTESIYRQIERDLEMS